MQEALPPRLLSSYANASAHAQIPLLYHVKLELCPFPSKPLIYSFHSLF